MSQEELKFKVDQLAYAIENSPKLHTESVARLTDEVKALRSRLADLKYKAEKKGKVEASFPADDSWHRKIEWTIADYSTKLRSLEKDTGIWSPEFSVLGMSPLQLEFFPNGRAATNLDGFCSLFLWCPPGVHIKYQLRVGSFVAAPDDDTYVSRMGHGHSNFCYLAAQVDQSSDSVTVGVEILSMQCTETASHPELPGTLRLMTTGPELVIQDEAAVLRNREVEEVSWTIKNIRKKMQEVPQGAAICSPIFCAGGVGNMLMEFYPNGIKSATGAPGFCGFYLRCPSGTSLIITLFVGKSSKGPIKTDFDGNAAKGLPEFCNLQEALAEGDDHITVGIRLRNRNLEAAEMRTSLEI